MLTVLRFCETEAARREAGSTGMRSAAEDLSCSTPHGGTKVVYLINPSSTHAVPSQQPRGTYSTCPAVAVLYTCRAPMITQDTAHDASTSAGDRYHWLRWRKVYRRFHHDKGKDANTGSSICIGELLQQRLQALCRHIITHWTRDGLVQQHQKQTARSYTPHHIAAHPLAAPWS